MPRKVLIANRGEIACRIARTCKRLGIPTVAVYSEADAAAPHVAACDEAVAIGRAPVRDSYLSIEKIVDAARRTGADAIHPGYGLLSEKGAFARAVRDAGLELIGPSAEALDALGDKLRARHAAQAVGVSAVPGTDGPVWPDVAVAEAAKVGYPLVVKAVGGGGGIGMQVVAAEAALARAVRTASDRGKQSFGDDRVYLERYIEKPRHVEVQIFADAHGNVVALGERECSLQRRHQKIVEESPSPGLDLLPDGVAIRARMLDAACRVARAAGYVGAGTCEFLLDATGRFYFLEVNARLQVEHPVTELRTGLDLVELQLRVADGERLPPEALRCQPEGYAVEARIYAENPDKMFMPAPGRIDELVWPPSEPDGATLRLDSGIAAGMTITPHYDPILAKMITWADTRERAVDALHTALSQTRIAPLVTNVPFLARMLASEEVREGRFDTTFAEAFAKGLTRS